MRFHLKGDRHPVAHVHDAGVLTHPYQQPLFHLLGGLAAELFAQMFFRGLVGAVLRPHDRIHCQLCVSWTPSQQLLNIRVFVVFEP